MILGIVHKEVYVYLKNGLEKPLNEDMRVDPKLC